MHSHRQNRADGKCRGDTSTWRCDGDALRSAVLM
jgi:hypothetical protein